MARAGGKLLVWATALTVGASVGQEAWAQAPTVPERIEPREAPTLPPGSGGDRGLSSPRSENPLAPSDGPRPTPDTGVLTPPSPGSSTVIPPPAAGETPVIRPPATGGMPVIPPPGSPGGNPTVVPR